VIEARDYFATLKPNAKVERPAATAAWKKKPLAGGSARTLGWASFSIAF